MAVKRKVLTNLRIDEVSSVDRGAGEGVKILLMKRDIKRKAMSGIGEMFSKLFSGGNNNSITIDKAVEGLAESVGSIVVESATPEELSANLAKTFEQFGEHLKSSNLTSAPVVIEKKENDMDLKAMAKAFGLPETATEAEVQAAVTKSIATTNALAASVKKMEKEVLISKADFTPAELDFWKASKYDAEEDTDDEPKAKAAKKFLEAGHVERGSIMKAAAPPVPAYIQQIMDDNTALKKQLSDLQAGGNLVAFGKRATEIGLPETEAVTLQKAYSGDPEAIAKLETHMKSLIATAKAGGVFKEFGAGGGTGVTATAMDELMALAKKAKDANPALTIEKAFAKVYEDPSNVEIVRRERAENRPAAA